MRLSSRKVNRTKRLELSLTSMIDVVFLLLIFFVTVMAIIETHVALRAALAKKMEGASQSSAKDALIIHLREVPEGSGEYVYFISEDRVYKSVSELRNFLIHEYDESLKSEPAIIRADPQVPFEYPANALTACTEANFAKVSIVPD